MLASVVMVIINLFSYICFLSQIEFCKKYRFFIFVCVVILTLCEVFYFLSLRKDIDSVFLIQFTASLVGISFLLFVSSIIYIIFMLPLKVIKFNQKRREALKYILDITIIILIISWIVKAFIGGFSKPLTRSVSIKIRNLKQPLSIVQLTDIHIGKVLGYEFLDECVKLTNALNPDIVVITGDLLDMNIEMAKDKLEPLKKIKSKFGIYFVTGNHEYFHGVQDIVNYLKTLNIKVLENDNVVLDNLINLSGVHDLIGERFGYMQPNVKQAMKNIDKNLPTVLLSHQPKIVNKLSEAENIDLIISGHTHGGQIFPFGFLVLLDQPYLYGLYKHNEKTQVFVSSGVGYWGPPLRVFAPSEIVKLELKPS